MIESQPPLSSVTPDHPGRGRVWPWVLLGVAFGVLVVLALAKAWPLLYPEVIASAPLDRSCDLRSGPCTARLPDRGEVSFGLEPRTIRPMTPLRIAVDLNGLEAHSVEVDFAGADMNMGFNRVPLGQVAAGRYEGQGTLPVCVRRRMDWEAKVMLHTQDGIMVAPFRFETVSDESSIQR